MWLVLSPFLVANFINICRLAVGTFDLVDCSLYVDWVFFVFNVNE